MFNVCLYNDVAFRYVKNQYNVIEVNKTGYDNCTLDGYVGNWTSGKDFILLNKSQRYYFICGTCGCFNGMKVTIRVHPLPSPTSSPVAAAEHLASSVAGKSVFGVSFMVLVSLIWFGFGAIC
ncbi:putative Phytocyanin domain, cupredoxin [Helianthus anomalus]